MKGGFNEKRDCLFISHGLMLGCFGTTAFAKPNKIIDYTMDQPDIYGESTQTQFRTMLTYYNIYLPVTGLSQYDSRWANDIMRYYNQYIWDAGCALTCATMIARHYGKITDPKQFNIDMGENACPFGWDLAGPRAGAHI